MHRPLCTRFNVENAGGFFCGGSKVMFPDSRKPLLPAPGGCREGKSAPAGRRFWNERCTDEKEKTYDKGCKWDEEKTRPSGTGQDAEADQRRDGEVLPRQLRGSQVQGREVRPESGGLYQGGGTGGHRDGKAYARGERTAAQPGGNGEQPEPADKALAPDRLLQDKAADRGVAGKAEADHG